MESSLGPIIAAAVASLVVLLVAIMVARGFKRCPSDKVMVVYGKTPDPSGMIVVTQGGRFVWPLIQEVAFLSKEPLHVEAELRALSKENIRTTLPFDATVGLSTDPTLLREAAQRLLSLTPDQIKNQARDIIVGQIRITVAGIELEQVARDPGDLLLACHRNIQPELERLGLKLINLNFRDINDESGYLDALGRKAAAEAINEDKLTIAEADRFEHDQKSSPNPVGKTATVRRTVPGVVGELGEVEILIDHEPQTFAALSLTGAIYEPSEVVVVEEKRVLIVKRKGL